MKNTRLEVGVTLLSLEILYFPKVNKRRCSALLFYFIVDFFNNYWLYFPKVAKALDNVS